MTWLDASPASRDSHVEALSAAMYLEGVRQLTGASLNYVYLVASRHAPYRVETFVPGPVVLNEGRRLFRQALERITTQEALAARYRA